MATLPARTRGRRKAMLMRSDDQCYFSSCSINTSTWSTRIILGIVFFVLLHMIYHAVTTTTTTTTTESLTHQISLHHYTSSPIEYLRNNNIIMTICEVVWQKTSTTEHQKSNYANTSTAATSSTMDSEFMSYLGKVKHYNKMVSEFQPLGVDIRTMLRNHYQNHNDKNKSAICDQIDLNLPNIFSTKTATDAANDNTELSEKHHYLSKGSRFGYMEPILPVLLHGKACGHNDDDDRHHHYSKSSSMANKEERPPTFLVHDFAHVCRQHVSSYSQMVYFDLGNTLPSDSTGFQFNSSLSQQQQQSSQQQQQHDTDLYFLYHLYHQFGFHFDHVYAYEPLSMDPNLVYGRQIPFELMAAYHWINVGINPTVQHRLNPLTMISQNYNEEDFIIMKLDIDASLPLESSLSLAYQILQNEQLTNLVDQLYIHYHEGNTTTNDKGADNSSIVMKDVMELLTQLRQRGIAAHVWA